MEQKTSIYLPIDQLHPHPDNPRKDLGDLTELIDSIRKNGILERFGFQTDPEVYRLLDGDMSVIDEGET